MAVVVLAVLAALHKELVLRTFDPDGAAAAGYRIAWLDLALNLVLVLVVVAAVRAVGTLLVIALIIVPAATARLLSDRLPVILASSVVVAVVGGYLGLVASYEASVHHGARLARGRRSSSSWCSPTCSRWAPGSCDERRCRGERRPGARPVPRPRAGRDRSCRDAVRGRRGAGRPATSRLLHDGDDACDLPRHRSRRPARGEPAARRRAVRRGRGAADGHARAAAANRRRQRHRRAALRRLRPGGAAAVVPGRFQPGPVGLPRRVDRHRAAERHLARRRRRSRAS